MIPLRLDVVRFSRESQSQSPIRHRILAHLVFPRYRPKLSPPVGPCAGFSFPAWSDDHDQNASAPARGQPFRTSSISRIVTLAVTIGGTRYGFVLHAERIRRLAEKHASVEGTVALPWETWSDGRVRCFDCESGEALSDMCSPAWGTRIAQVRDNSVHIFDFNWFAPGAGTANDERVAVPVSSALPSCSFLAPVGLKVSPGLQDRQDRHLPLRSRLYDPIFPAVCAQELRDGSELQCWGGDDGSERHCRVERESTLPMYSANGTFLRM